MRLKRHARVRKKNDFAPNGRKRRAVGADTAARGSGASRSRPVACIIAVRKAHYG